VRVRIFGLCFSISIILMSAFALWMVGKIVAIGGAAYRWEFIPPSLMLGWGLLLLAFWILRIRASKRGPHP